MSIHSILKTAYHERDGKKYVVKSLLADFDGRGATLREALQNFYMTFAAFWFACKRVKEQRPNSVGRPKKHVQELVSVHAQVSAEAKKQIDQLREKYDLSQGEVIAMLLSSFQKCEPQFVSKETFDKVEAEVESRLQYRQLRPAER